MWLLPSQDEAFLAALSLGVPDWAHAHLLQAPSMPDSICNDASSPSGSRPGKERTLAALLRPFPHDQLQLGRQLEVATNDKCALCRGTIAGQSAVIKQYRLSSPGEALKAAAEVRNYQHRFVLCAKPGATH